MNAFTTSIISQIQKIHGLMRYFMHSYKRQFVTLPLENDEKRRIT